jgi:Tol biopolymer transport system component
MKAPTVREMVVEKPIWSRVVGGTVVRIIAVLNIVNPIASCGPVQERHGTAPHARCQFGPGEDLGPLVNSPGFDGSPTVSADETELLFTSSRAGQQDIFVASRPTRDAVWSKPVNVGMLLNDSIGDDFSLRLSSDGKALYFASNRSGGFGRADMYVARRASRQHPWGHATNLGPLLNTEAFEAFPTPSADDQRLYFNRSTTFDSPDSDIWVTARAGPEEQWSVPQRVTGRINSERAEFSPSLSNDENTLYFASERSGSIEVWVSKRDHLSPEWGTPQRLGVNVNVPRSMTLAPFISDDQRSLYFMSARAEAGAGEACTPMTCFDRVDLYVARLDCPNR